MPPAHQRLLFEGREMADGKTLADYDLCHGSTVQLVLRICGGAPKKKKKGGDGEQRTLQLFGFATQTLVSPSRHPLQIIQGS